MTTFDLGMFGGIVAIASSIFACSDDPATDSDVSVEVDSVSVEVDDDVSAEVDDSSDTSAAEIDAPDVPSEPDPGALVRVTITSTVAYLLEDVPVDLRDALAAQLVGKPASFWIERAELQLSTTRYRLGYRRLFSFLQKGILPLPPAAQRTTTLASTGPTRTTIDGHDVVAIDYTVTGVLLTDTASVAVAEPALAEIGGAWDEPFVAPADPDLLMQRTGNACIRELAETSELLDAENAPRFYDFMCLGSELLPLGCHSAPYPDDCEATLAARVGKIAMGLHFERLPWDAALADAVRIPFANPDVPDLKVLPSGLLHHQILYSYVEPDSCSVREACVGGSGWRRLLRFDASLENVGAKDLYIGPLKNSPYLEHNSFEFSPCHDHYHFRFYGDFVVDDGAGAIGRGDKRAFCLLSTSRYANNEDVPMTHEHDLCFNQGIVRGWGDDYFAGLDCQWIDITDVPVDAEQTTMTLRFDANPQSFLCEGEPLVDADGAQLFTSTEYMTEDNLPIDRPECTQAEGYADNNHGSAPVIVPKSGGMVTLPCTRGQSGSKRDCGFVAQADAIACTPGEPVTLSCSVPDLAAGQVVRVCERSVVLGETIACTYREGVTSALVRGEAQELSFTCPAARGADEPGGVFGLLRAPIVDGQASQEVTCVVK